MLGAVQDGAVRAGHSTRGGETAIAIQTFGYELRWVGRFWCTAVVAMEPTSRSEPQTNDSGIHSRAAGGASHQR